MVGCSDHYGVNLVSFCFNHFAIICVTAWLEVILFRQHGFSFAEIGGIDVDDRDDVFAHDAADVFGRSVCGADASDVEFLQHAASWFRTSFGHEERR